jgi:hypothetical protein
VLDMAELITPGCERGCDPCYRSCAAAKIIAAYWLREEERLLRERPPLSARHRPAWLDDLQEAQGHLERLREDMQGDRKAASEAQPTRNVLPYLTLVHSEPKSPYRERPVGRTLTA